MSTTNQRDRPEAFARAPGSACDAGQAPAAPYRPSNGTEGDCFRAEFCLRCAKWRNGTCGIELRAMLHDTDEKGYPRQWVRGVTGPRCTAFRLKGTPPATRRGQRSAPGQSELFASPNALAAGRPPNEWQAERRFLARTDMEGEKERAARKRSLERRVRRVQRGRQRGKRMRRGRTQRCRKRTKEGRDGRCRPAGNRGGRGELGQSRRWSQERAARLNG